MKIKQMLLDKKLPLSKDLLVSELKVLGLCKDDKVMVHSSLSSFGYVIDGERAVIDAIIEVVGPNGVVLMPGHSSWNSDPSEWSNPPMPAEWIEHISNGMLPYDKNKTSIDFVGSIPRVFSKYDGVYRTNHPSVSFLIWGGDDSWHNQPLDYPLGKASQLMKLCNEGGKVLMLGTEYENVTALHLSEYLSDKVDCEVNKSKMIVDGESKWVSFTEKEAKCEFYNIIGRIYEKHNEIESKVIGYSSCKLVDVKSLVECGKQFFDQSTLKSKTVPVAGLRFLRSKIDKNVYDGLSVKGNEVYAFEIDGQFVVLEGLEYIYKINSKGRSKIDIIVVEVDEIHRELFKEWLKYLAAKNIFTVKDYSHEDCFKDNDRSSWETMIEDIVQKLLEGVESMNNIVE